MDVVISTTVVSGFVFTSTLGSEEELMDVTEEETGVDGATVLSKLAWLLVAKDTLFVVPVLRAVENEDTVVGTDAVDVMLVANGSDGAVIVEEPNQLIKSELVPNQSYEKLLLNLQRKLSNLSIICLKAATNGQLRSRLGASTIALRNSGCAQGAHLIFHNSAIWCRLRRLFHSL